MLKQPAGQQVNNSSGAPGGARNTEKPCSLGDLPAGFMGKMLVYRSGAIKMKLGDTLYDVSTFHYNNEKGLSSCFELLGALNYHALVIYSCQSPKSGRYQISN